MQSDGENRSGDDELLQGPPTEPDTDEERGVGLPLGPLHHQARSTSSSNGYTEGNGHSDIAPESTQENGVRTQATSLAEAASISGNYIKKKTSQLIQVVTGPHKLDQPLSSRLAALVDAYASSEIAAVIQAEVDELTRSLSQGTQTPVDPNQLPDVAAETSLLRGRQRASWATQFRILSGRAFKNLYRDPALLATHYLSSIIIACKSYFTPG